jgi:hypothetical protein
MAQVDASAFDVEEEDGEQQDHHDGGAEQPHDEAEVWLVWFSLFDLHVELDADRRAEGWAKAKAERRGRVHSLRG